MKIRRFKKALSSRLAFTVYGKRKWLSGSSFEMLFKKNDPKQVADYISLNHLSRHPRPFYDYSYPLLVHLFNMERYGLSLSGIKVKRSEMWNCYKPSKQYSKRLSTPLIPQKLHKIWLTSPASPNPIPQKYLNFLKHDQSILGNEWTFQLWGYPESFNDHPIQSVQIHSPSLFQKHILFGKFQEHLDQGRFAFASDLLRLMILEKEGGVYPDTDIFLTRSIDPLVHMYESVFTQMQDGRISVCNSVIMTQPDHPIIKGLIQAMQDTKIDSLLGDIIQDFKNPTYETILMTGPLRITLVLDYLIDLSKPQVILPRLYLAKGVLAYHNRDGSWLP